MKIFITGGTGFIGSHVVRAVLAGGHEVVALRRKNSSLVRSADFLREVAWLDHDASDWTEAVAAKKPEVIIHCAWRGVTADERADWKLQAENLILSGELLKIAVRVGLSQFIALGSQAEYGAVEGRVNEAHPCRPETAYGTTKLAALTLLQGFARQHKLNWVWLRLFSVYGPGESGTWFVPNLIQQMQRGSPPQLSGCEQRYDYLHVHDVAAGVLAVLSQPGQSGVFNLSSNASWPLKHLVQLIKEHTQCKVEPAFGALPYRAGQSMHIEGDSTRFNQTFNFQPRINLGDGLRQTIEATLQPAGAVAPKQKIIA